MRVLEVRRLLGKFINFGRIRLNKLLDLLLKLCLFSVDRDIAPLGGCLHPTSLGFLVSNLKNEIVVAILENGKLEHLILEVHLRILFILLEVLEIVILHPRGRLGASTMGVVFADHEIFELLLQSFIFFAEEGVLFHHSISFRILESLELVIEADASLFLVLEISLEAEYLLVL